MNRVFPICLVALFCLVLGAGWLKAQPMISCPGVTASPDTTLSCSGCVNLNAVPVAGFQPTTYTAQQIPFSPYSTAGTPIIVNVDDVWSSVLPLPFNFCFYGNTYNQCIIGSNGILSFNVAQANGYCQWPINAGIPSTANPVNCIMGAFHDIDPSVGGTIRWALYGTAPCRVFVVSFVSVPMYQSSCNSLLATQQIVIYETTNIIETYIQNKPLCTSWNSGAAIHGIQNATGTQATVVPGRNYPTQWTASNDGWRFVPAGPQNFTISWFQVGNPTPIANTSTTQVCPPVSTDYYAQVTYTNCNNSTVVVRDTVNIMVNGPQIPLNPTLNNPNCPGSTDGSISLNPTGGQAPYTYQWSPSGGTAATTTPIGAGTYTVTVTDNNSCVVIDSFTLVDPTAISISISQTNVACFGGSNGSATASASGGTPPYSYLWNPGNIAGPTANGLSAGTYTVVVTDDNACQDSVQVTITQPTALSTSTSSTATSCANGNDGTATVNPSGGTPGYTYAWNSSPVQTTATATGLSAGTYAVTVTDLNLCTIVDSVAVTSPLPVVAQVVRHQDVSCNGSTDGWAVVSATGQQGPLTYSWNTSPVQTADSAFGLAPGTWTVTVTDSLGCQSSASVTIAEPSPISLLMEAQNISCHGSTDGCASVIASGGHGNFSYLWSNSGTADSICNLGPGTYAVSVTDTFYTGTTNRVLYFEDFDGPLNWTLNVPTGTNGVDNNFWVANDNEGGMPPLSCGTAGNGDSTLHITSVFNPNGGAAYDAGGFCGTLFCPETNMRAESPVISTVGFSGITLSFNFIANGDSIFDNASVLMNDGTGWTTLAPSIKSNVCLNLQGEWQAFSVALPASANNNPNLRIGFNWTNNDDGVGTDPSVAINNVQLSVAPANTPPILCSAVDSIQVTQPDSLQASFNVLDVACNGDSSGCIGLSVVGGNGNYSYLWSNGATTDSICGLIAGTYVVTVTDTSGVSSSSNSVTLYTEDFEGANAWVLNTATGPLGADPNFWVINDNEGGVLPPGCGIGNNGNSTLHITSFIFPTAGAAYDAGGLCGLLTCPQTNYRAESPAISTLATTNLTLSFDYISMGDGLLDNCSVVYNDGTGWQTLAPSIKSLVCVSLQGQWTAFSMALPASCNNIPNLRVGLNWTNNDDGIGTDPSVAINNVVVTGLQGGSASPVFCTLVDSIQVNQPSPLVLGIAGYDATCFGAADGAAAVTATGGTPGYSVLWSNLATGDSISGLAAGTYVAAVTDSLGCTDTISVAINEPSPLVVVMDSVPVTCNGDSNGCTMVTASGGTGGYTYFWSNGGTNDTVCGLPAGNYSVTVTDTVSASCFVIGNVVVTEPLPINLSGSFTGSACGTPTGTATVSASGGTPPYTYAWNTNPVQTTATATGLVPGTYTVLVTDTLGCTDTLSVTIPNIPPPTISLVSSTDVGCFGDSSGSATVQVSGGTQPMVVTWNTSPSQTGLTATGLPAGTYTAIVTDTFGCADTLSVSIAEPSLLTVAVTGVGATCNLANGSASATASGGTPPYQYNWSNNQSGSSISNLPAGNYTVTVTDLNQCTAIGTVAIQQAGSPSISLSQVTPVTCNGGSDGTATVTVNSGTPPYSIVWGTNPQQTGTTANGLLAGTYLVTVTDANGCTASATAVVTEPSRLTGLMFATDVTCASAVPNGTAGVVASGGVAPYTYVWNTNPPQNTPQVTGLVDGIYTVTVTDANGCEFIGMDTVNRQPVPSVVAGPGVSFCEGEGGATLLAIGSGGTPGYYYQWWCDSTSTFCGLDSINDNDPLANPTVSTWYYVQVIDTNGCPSNIDSVFVTVLPKPIVDAGPDIFLCGDSAPCQLLNPSIVNANLAPGPYTYTWIPSAGLNDSTIANPCARPDSTTIYALVVTSGNGCSSDYNTTDTLATVTVHVNPIPIAEAGPDLDICNGDSAILQAYGTGAGPNYIYNWTPGNAVSDSTIANPYAVPPFTTILSLVVWSNGCPSYADSVEVRVHTMPTVEAGWDREICLGESVMLDAQAGGDSTANYGFLWWPTDGFISDSTAEDPFVSPDTTTTYHVVAVSNWGCESAPDSATVHLKPTPIAEAGDDFFMCFGTCDTLQGSYHYTTTAAAPNPSEVYYAWSPNSTISDTTTLRPEVCPPASQWYYLEVRHRDCTTRDSVLVNIGPEVGANASADTAVICRRESVQLSSGGSLGTEFNWYPPAGLDDPASPNPLATPDSTTTYYLVVSEGGCFDTTSVIIEVLPGPDAGYVSSLSQGCAPHAVQFTNLSTEGIYYVWDFGDGSPVSNEEQPLIHTYSQAGQYVVSLTATGTGACSSTIDSIRIVVMDTAVADFSSDPAFPVQLTFPATGVNFRDLSIRAQNWYWDFGDGQTSTETHPSHQFMTPGEYFVTLIVNNALGCASRITHGPFVVAVPELFIPNVFSPNDDGVNDFFRVDYTGDQPFNLQVYDRWGVLVYESNNKVKGWNGKNLDGTDVSAGIYYYHVKAGNRKFAGDVTLIR